MLWVTSLLSIFLVLGGGATADSSGKQLEAVVMNVGQGDGILIQLPSEKYVLIDAGYSGSIGLMPYLRARRIQKIEALVMTHPHADHIGGVDEVLQEFDVGNIYDSGKEHTLKTYEKILKTIQKRGIPYFQPRAGEVLKWDDNTTVRVLHPDRADYSNINDNSIVLHVQFGGVSLLFTGDAEKQAERAILKNHGHRLRADILKVGHHGSNSSSSPDFIQAVSPRYALISCGLENSFGHPTPQTLSTLKEAGARTYRTDMDGYLFIRTDGRQIWDSAVRLPFPKIALKPDIPVPFDRPEWSENRTDTAMSEGTGIQKTRGKLIISAAEHDMLQLGSLKAPFLIRPAPAGANWHVVTDVSMEAGNESEGGLMLFAHRASFMTFAVSGDGKITLRMHMPRSTRRFRQETIFSSAKKIGIRRDGGRIEFIAHDDKEAAWKRLWEFQLSDFPINVEEAGIGPFAGSRKGWSAKAVFENLREYAPDGISPAAVHALSPEAQARKYHMPAGEESTETAAHRPPTRGGLSVTVLETYELWKTTKNVEEIARIRGLTASSIEMHLARLFQHDQITLNEIFDHLVDRETFEKVATVVKNLNTNRTAEVHAQLPDVGYGKIRMVMEVLRKRGELK